MALKLVRGKLVGIERNKLNFDRNRLPMLMNVKTSRGDSSRPLESFHIKNVSGRVTY